MTGALARSASRIGWAGPSLLACAALSLPISVPLAHAQETPATALATPGVPFRREPPLRSYVAIRRMESVNDRHRKEAWLVVRTQLREDGAYTWQVLGEGGSELIRNRVLRPALEREAQAHRDGRSKRGGLTTDNYTFSAPSPVEGGMRVGIEPRKREDMLVRGTLLVSADGELLRVEGDLVKRPSFWTKAVHLVRHYGRVQGAHVPLRLDMVAQIRLVGTSRLSMTYQYLEVNGQAVPDSASPTVVVTEAAGTRAPVH